MVTIHQNQAHKVTVAVFRLTALLLSVFLILPLLVSCHRDDDMQDMFEELMQDTEAETPEETSPPETARTEETDPPEETASPEPDEETFPSHEGELLNVDFGALRKENEDICAWLEIPGTSVSFPVVQHPTDDTYYLNHNEKKQNDIYGAIFIESYNQNDFSDPMTVIYGHTSVKGKMFGTLQKEYSNQKSIDEHPLINVYLPAGVVQYRFFSAVPYSPIHLLYYYDMADRNVYKALINDIYQVRRLDAIQDPNEKPVYGDKLLVLSTCVYGDNTHRFLIFAKKVAES